MAEALIELPAVLPINITKPIGPVVKKDVIDSTKTANVLLPSDTTRMAKANLIVVPEILFYKDSTRKRVLFFGDSERGTVKKQVN